MITTRAVPALLPAHHRRVARPHISLKDFADPLPDFHGLQRPRIAGTTCPWPRQWTANGPATNRSVASVADQVSEAPACREISQPRPRTYRSVHLRPAELARAQIGLVLAARRSEIRMTLPTTALSFPLPMCERKPSCPRVGRFDTHRLHDAIERDLRPRAFFVHECRRRSLEQEQGQAVGWDQDAAQRSDRASRRCRARTGLGDASEDVPDLRLVDSRPVALDHEGCRGSSLRAVSGAIHRAGAAASVDGSGRVVLATRPRGHGWVFERAYGARGWVPQSGASLDWDASPWVIWTSPVPSGLTV